MPIKKTVENDRVLQKLVNDQARRQTAALEARLDKKDAELEDVRAEMESFAYSISHDLRAPIIHIGGFVDLLVADASSVLPEQSRHYLQRIAESTYHLGRMVDDLLAWSRLGRAEMHVLRLELKDLMKEVMNDVKPQIQGRTIHWTIGDLPAVYGDPTLLRMALLNLVSNAVKFTRPRPEARIEVGADRRPGEVVIFVRDNGVGFNPQQEGKLFGVFQRLHATAEFEGSGVGLAHVRRIIQRHGGRTWAEGAVDGGATFYFSLPEGAGRAP